MENTINLTISQIRAMLCLAAEKDTRRYLNGVYIERRAGRTALVAADGHVLGALTVAETQPGESVPPDFDAIMPRDWLEQIVKAAGAGVKSLEYPVTITVTPDPASTDDEPKPPRLTAAVVGGKATGTTFSAVGVDGRFPNWRRVLPPVQAERGSAYNATMQGQPHRPAVAQFNPRLLVRFQDAGCYLCYRRPADDDRADRVAVRWVAPHTTTHGTPLHGAHLVALNGIPQFVGVAMPLRDNGEAAIRTAERELAALRGEPVPAEQPDTDTETE